MHPQHWLAVPRCGSTHRHETRLKAAVYAEELVKVPTQGPTEGCGFGALALLPLP
jgi:hypothetical protein